MTVLVTGGAGYIGSHMVLALLDSGRKVVVIDNLSTGFRWAVPQGAAFVEGDCGDRELVARTIARHEVDAIAHFAGLIVVPDSVSDPLGYYRGNTVTSHALVETAVAWSASSSPRRLRSTAMRTGRRSPKARRRGRSRPTAPPS